MTATAAPQTSSIITIIQGQFNHVAPSFQCRIMCSCRPVEDGSYSVVITVAPDGRLRPPRTAGSPAPVGYLFRVLLAATPPAEAFVPRRDDVRPRLARHGCGGARGH